MLCTIVGAGTGLGAALIRKFLTNAFDVAFISRGATRLENTLDLPASLRAHAKGFPADVNEPLGLQQALDNIRQWRGDTDVLIYNAARMVPDDAAALTSEQLMLSIRTNVGGALQCVQDVLPRMQTKRTGTILFTGGGQAIEPYPHWASLAAGKAALRSLAINLHKQLKPDGIHVAVLEICGIIEPGGLFDPDRIADIYWNAHAEETARRRREIIYLPRGADPYYNDPDGIYRSTSEPMISGRQCKTND